MTKLLTIWRTTFVRRWHKNPDIYDTADMQHGHAGRMAVMALHLWPADYALAAACTLHDIGEGGDGPGDMCGMAKRQNPELASHIAEAEAEAYDRLGLPVIEDTRVHTLDRLDAYLWVALKRPHLLARKEWRVARQEIAALAQHLNQPQCDAICAAVLKATHEG